MAYWLFKSEPNTYSWDTLVKDGGTHWDGVRNYQAANNMKAMKIGDKGLYYHSNIGKEIVGMVEVTKEYYPDHTDKSGRFGMVDIKPLCPAEKFVTLAEIKQNPKLQDLALVTHSRLSVQPVEQKHWKILTDLARFNMTN